jgi:hypothetical protein
MTAQPAEVPPPSGVYVAATPKASNSGRYSSASKFMVILQLATDIGFWRAKQ